MGKKKIDIDVEDDEILKFLKEEKKEKNLLKLQYLFNKAVELALKTQKSVYFDVANKIFHNLEGKKEERIYIPPQVIVLNVDKEKNSIKLELLKDNKFSITTQKEEEVEEENIENKIEEEKIN